MTADLMPSSTPYCVVKWSKSVSGKPLRLFIGLLLTNMPE
jgi:hypothetical protein